MTTAELITIFMLAATVFALYRVCDRIDAVARAVHEYRATVQSIDRNRKQASQ